MQKPLTLSLCVALFGLCASCTQVHYPPRASQDALAATTWPQLDRSNDAGQGADGNPQRSERSQQKPDHYEEPGRPYSGTRARLQLFREDLELNEWDIDFDGGPDGKLRDIDRKRTGFRAEFGRASGGGFFQLFREKLDAPALLTQQFTNFGLGGGVAGAPTVGQMRSVAWFVPYRFEANFVFGSEDANGFDQDLWYAESTFELAFGARFLGLQSSSGIMINSIAGLFDTDDPGNPAASGDADLTGTNIGAYLEVLYKHPRVPLMARIRGVVGDIQGVMLSFGFAF